MPEAPSVPESATATEPVMVASAPSAAETPSVPVPSIPAPVQIPVEPPHAQEPGFFQSVDPMLLAGAGVLVAGLAGAGLYLRSRRRPDSAETSFLESRLQPDSFFGASGGQRVDTRDASGGPSSMSYSLSQLDAIGDVDPVAEADVYLAYGRDLQAEEILKEALRSNPDRLAIRTKLLEVYAKRRDTKGYEALAAHLYGLTGGEGEDWARAQEMGLSIDPENPLYQPGGQPSALAVSQPEPYEALGASTVPVSVMPVAAALASQVQAEPLPEPEPTFEAPALNPSDDGLDLDISAPAPLDFPEVPEPAAAPMAQPEAVDDLSMDLDLPEVEFPASAPTPDSAPEAAVTEPVSLSALAEEAAPSPAADASFDFDLSSISLDLDEPAKPEAPVEAPADTPLEFGGEDASDDPMARKLDLAEEFRQIGDVDGARELLQEVLASTDDAVLKSKAQSMLDSLN